MNGIAFALGALVMILWSAFGDSIDEWLRGRRER